jgi:AraC family transcriptional regulator
VRSTTRSDYVQRLQRVLRFIQERLDEDLTPERCASVAHFSRYHFHRIFRGLVGESLGEHIRRLRLERAAGELRRSDRTVIDIALTAGYDAHEPFTRAFRAHFGMPPAAFRKREEPFALPLALCGVHYGIDDAVSRFVPMQEDSHMIDVNIEHHPARHLLALPHHGDYLQVGDAFQRLFEYAAPQGLVSPETLSIGIYYDDPDATPADQLRAHAGLTVPPTFTAVPDGFELLELPAGLCAVGVHRGPYSRLLESYRWLFGQWLPASGKEAGNHPPREIYVNDPATTAPEDLVTHICVPLAER